MRFNIEKENNENKQKSKKLSINTSEIFTKVSKSIEKIESIQEEYIISRKNFLNRFKDELSVVFIDFFKAVPKITKISWTQYTPYFMDGDACEFSVNEVQFTINDENYSIYDLKKSGISSDELTICTDLNVVLSNGENFFEELLGDHIEVTVNQDGEITTEECEHD